MKGSNLRHAESKRVGQWHVWSEHESERFTDAPYVVEIVPILQLIMVAARGHYTPSNPSECSALEVIVGRETDK